MALRLAMEVPQRFAAVAAVVAAMPKDNTCQDQKQPISVLFMNDTDDPLLPYRGGQVAREKHGRGTTASTAVSVQYWLDVTVSTPNLKYTNSRMRLRKTAAQ